MYKAFGLNIDSEVDFKGFESGAAPADVEIKFGQVSVPWAQSDQAEQRYVRVEGDDAYIVWASEEQQDHCIKISAGRQITVDTRPGYSPSFVQQAIQGLGMGLLLQQRKEFVLHASAVKIGAEAVVFIGFKGAGKSTTASALFANKHALVTDDLLVIKMPEGDPRAYALPGIPSLKLWPDSVRASLGEDPHSLPRIFAAEEKRMRYINKRFVTQPVPLRSICVLEFSEHASEEPTLEPLNKGAACIELIRHSYGLRFLENNGRNKEHLLQTSALLKRVPVFRLVRGRSLSDISKLVACIEAHGQH